MMDNSVNDDNIECINWQDLVDMGIPVAPAKQLTWIVRKRRHKKEVALGENPNRLTHPGEYFPGPEGQRLPNDKSD